jgi:hypothetical protein
LGYRTGYTKYSNIPPVLGGRVRYLFTFTREIAAYVVVNRAWWIVPIFLLLALATLVVVVGQVVAPFSLYSFF